MRRKGQRTKHLIIAECIRVWLELVFFIITAHSYHGFSSFSFVFILFLTSDFLFWFSLGSVS